MSTVQPQVITLNIYLVSASCLETLSGGRGEMDVGGGGSEMSIPPSPSPLRFSNVYIKTKELKKGEIVRRISLVI